MGFVSFQAKFVKLEKKGGKAKKLDAKVPLEEVTPSLYRTKRLKTGVHTLLQICCNL